MAHRLLCTRRTGPDADPLTDRLHEMWFGQGCDAERRWSPCATGISRFSQDSSVVGGPEYDTMKGPFAPASGAEPAGGDPPPAREGT
jgi:hypothetical protein